MGPSARLLPDGHRLHLQHGPIDLILSADGDRRRAFEAATRRFATILDELVAELPMLRQPFDICNPSPTGEVAQRMHQACDRLKDAGFLTPMIAVAGAVADEVLAAMRKAAELSRASVNNGGDIALFLAGAARYRTQMADHTGKPLGQIELTAKDGIGGIATSGRHGRSHSFGIADSVTVLAKNAAAADAAATLIANAVDLPGHPSISRTPANELDDMSDLGGRMVVTNCTALAPSECCAALTAGRRRAEMLQSRGLIHGAALFLQSQSAATRSTAISLCQHEATYA